MCRCPVGEGAKRRRTGAVTWERLDGEGWAAEDTRPLARCLACPGADERTMSSSPTSPSLELVRAIPKVCLHEHLDGSLRPATVLELARRARYADLPHSEPEALGRWFFEGANRKHLSLYLEGFRHTIA